MKKLGFVFRSSAHQSSKGREGLDALLAASAYCDDISVFFIGDGVSQLLAEQQPAAILGRDYVSAFKLMELYDIESVFICESSLSQMGLIEQPLVIDVQIKSPLQIAVLLEQCEKILTF